MATPFILRTRTRLSTAGTVGAAVLMAACSTAPEKAMGSADGTGADKKASAPAAPVQVYAAGSLRDAFTAIARDYKAHTGQPVAVSFGASGLLRGRIEAGEPAQVFASADTAHPARLAAQGGWKAPVVFTRNALCALTSAQGSTTPEGLLATLLRPDVRLGTSTPKADPSGDYAWEMFGKAEALQAGAAARLTGKAMKLAGAADSPQPPAGRNHYGWIMETSQADVFLTYCTNAVAAQKQVPRLKVVQLPAALQVGASYGLGVRADASAPAQAFARALLEAPAQSVLTRLGFGKP